MSNNDIDISGIKTDYSSEIEEVLSTFFTTAEPPEIEGEVYQKTLDQIYQDITNILPYKWIEIEHVHAALTKLGFAPHVAIDPEGNPTLKYFVRIKMY